MSKSTFGNQLPRALSQDLKLVGEQIRLACLRRNLSMEQIAERATCSVPSLASVENGKPTEVHRHLPESPLCTRHQSQ